MYQLWLDELYPRAKFSDGLSMIEKLGHSRRLQIMRKEWIDEGHHSITEAQQPRINSKESSPTGGIVPTNGHSGSGEPTAINGHVIPDTIVRSERETSVHEPDEDELDALLAEDVAQKPAGGAMALKPLAAESEFDDEEEAMAGIIW
jgi:replication fork protection complex subunit Csm3/Swi3